MTACVACNHAFAAPDAPILTCPRCAVQFLPPAALSLTLQTCADGGAPRDAGLVELTPAFRKRFQLGRVLGRGSMGSVLQAKRLADGALVAVKFLIRTDDAVQVERFLREGMLTKEVQHPNVVCVYELFDLGGYPCLVTELLTGGTLRDRMDPGVKAPVAEVVGLLDGVLAGLAACHARGIVHRDLKPENILFDGAGRPKVADFGIARVFQSEAKLTRTGTILGTPRYMAPEQALGEAVGPASDVYAAACIAFEMLAGEPLFDGRSLHELLEKHIAEAPRALASVRADAPPALARAIAKALAKEPSKRPADARAFAAALGNAVAPEAEPRAGASGASGAVGRGAGGSSGRIAAKPDTGGSSGRVAAKPDARPAASKPVARGAGDPAGAPGFSPARVLFGVALFLASALGGLAVKRMHSARPAPAQSGDGLLPLGFKKPGVRATASATALWRVPASSGRPIGWARDSRSVLQVDETGQLVSYDINTGASHRCGHFTTPKPDQLLMDGGVAVQVADGRLEVLDSEGPRALTSLVAHVQEARLSPDGGRICVRNGDRDWSVIELYGDSRRPFSCEGLAGFATNGAEILVVRDGHAVAVSAFSFDAPKPVQFPVPAGPALMIAERYLIARDPRTLMIHRYDRDGSGAAAVSYPGPAHAFAMNGAFETFAADTGPGGTLEIRGLGDGVLYQHLPTSGVVREAAFTESGHWLATLDADGKLTCWEMPFGTR